MSFEVLQKKDFIIFSTRDFATTARVELSQASHQLKRFEQKKIVSLITRGLWANVHHPYFTPLAATQFLLNKERGYISFLTALHLHGMISQIPTTIQLATTGQARLLVSAIGRYEFFHVSSKLFKKGIEWVDTHCPYQIATPEKALLDTLYLSTRKGRRFFSLPELEFPKIFSKARFIGLIKEQVTDPKIQSVVLKRADRYFIR